MANKPGLADLKKLRQQAEAATAPKPAARPNKNLKKGTRGKPLGSGGLSSATASNQSVSHASASPAAHLARQGARNAAPRPAGTEAVPEQDVALFRQTMRFVQPIKDTGRAILPPVPKAAKTILKDRRAAAQGQDFERPTQKVSDVFAPALPHAERGDSDYLRHGVGPDVLKNLKRGKWAIVASIDLHGATLEQARDRLDQFIQSCITHNVRCVQVVHGKGYGSRDGAPVLKEVVRRWLTQFDAVQAYTECPENNGGSGAVQVLLKAAPAN